MSTMDIMTLIKAIDVVSTASSKDRKCYLMMKEELLTKCLDTQKERSSRDLIIKELELINREQLANYSSVRRFTS